jgi:DNA (cytosine-5)-methyltransferase 1
VRRAETPAFRFIDLCAGIGGFRWALARVGGSCRLSLERDPAAQKTYRLLHGDWPVWKDEESGLWGLEARKTLESRVLPPSGAGDITRFAEDYREAVPPHDVLAAGFPCQPFSLAGVSKKNALGRPHGFDDEDQGQLFFRILEIAEARKPKVLLLENVKNLRSHDGGRTWDVIRSRLLENHHVASTVIDARFWVPQHRERTIIVAVRKGRGWSAEDVERGVQGRLNVLKQGRGVKRTYETLGDVLEVQPGEQYIVGEGTWDTLVRHKQHHAEAGNGFGYGLVRTRQLHDPEFSARTLSARYHKDGAEVLIERPSRGGEEQRPRRLTPYECAGLMGLPEALRRRYHPEADQDESLRARVADVHLYRQLGNSVVFPVVGAVARIVADVLAQRPVQRTSRRTRSTKSRTESTELALVP